MLLMFTSLLSAGLEFFKSLCNRNVAGKVSFATETRWWNHVLMFLSRCFVIFAHSHALAFPVAPCIDGGSQTCDIVFIYFNRSASNFSQTGALAASDGACGLHAFPCLHTQTMESACLQCVFEDGKSALALGPDFLLRSSSQLISCILF